ncbi:MAG: hypothetical protein ACREDR_48770, partial [Blastocatellia bacterium]
MSGSRPLRVFVDSNVLINAVVAKWGLNKAILSICAAGICNLVLSVGVKEEVENALLVKVSPLEKVVGDEILAGCDKFVFLARPEVVPRPAKSKVDESRHLIRHQSDVPVLVSALACSPDWVITNNREHFNEDVAQRTGLRIGTPLEFFAA